MTSSTVRWKPYFKTLFLLLIFFAAAPVRAGISVESLPEELKDWVHWVLHDQEEKNCPFLQSGGDERNCSWSGRLDLSLNATSGQFSQSWQVYAETEIPLPGDEDHWPQDVKAGGQAVAVLPRDRMPVIYLKPGTYQITGTFQWPELPESFPIPAETGLLRLVVKGEEKNFPQVDEAGLLWIQKESEAEEGENRLEMRVNRKLTDGIPFLLTTHLNLNVSGQNREVILDKVLPENFVAMNLKSPVPARLDKDGKLRIQVKPGNWRIEIEARHLGPLNALAFEEHGEPWPSEEIWVFEAQPNLRLVWVEGVASIDPQQTTLPDEWKNLPAYRLAKGDTLALKEKRRGDSDPAPDQLQIYREWWLDFNGGGYTLHDRITGTFHRSWRLDMSPPVELGRISVDGKDQFITQLPGDKRWGVEIRQGRAEVDADSRIPSGLRTLPAIGWEQNFQQVSGVLNLPPGWRAFSILGVDEAPQTWIHQWTLWDFFLALVTALAFVKLFGWRWGILALATFALTFPEQDSPQWIWLALVAGIALLAVLPKGKFWKLIRIYRFATLLVLIAISIPFMVKQIRVGMFPALEHRWQSMSNEGAASGEYDQRAATVPMAQPMAAPAAPPRPEMNQVAEDKAVPMEAPALEKTLDDGDGSVGGIGSSNAPARMKLKRAGGGAGYGSQDLLNLQQQRPGTKVQTGPGLPRWNWNRVDLTWNGPVEKSQSIRFFLLSPLVNLFLAVLRVILLAALLLCVLVPTAASWPRFLKPRVAVLLLALTLGATAGFWPAAARADFPPNDLLDQLRERLLEDPICAPDCAAISRATLTATEKSLQLRIEINAHALTAVPLPGNAKEWSPQQIMLDGQATSGLTRRDDGNLWLNVGPGVHQVVLEGILPDRDTVQISLPLKPHRLEAQATGWALEGLQEDGTVENNLQLTRSAGNVRTGDASADAGAQFSLPPFVYVEREIVLGLTWEVVTRVVRVTPAGTPVVLEIPLLEGESVITPDIRVANGKVMVNMSPTASDLEWRSVLAETPKVELKAGEAPGWMEVWRLNAAPIWHVKFTGIPFLHPASPESSWLPEWRPWPGETLAIDISRPEGVPGQTVTIDQSTAKLTPGLRFTETSLNMTMRSSLGGQHVLTLPAGSDLQSVTINGQVQPIRLDGQKITLPLVPGSQSIEIKWQQPTGIGMFFRAPEINLGIPSVNSETQFMMPYSRWVLYAGGPRMGPAVLFWSLLAVVLLFSVGVSRTRLTPLGTASWFLLGIGISQFPGEPVIASLFVGAWLLCLGWRCRNTELGPWLFDLRQIFLVLYTIAALIVLFIAIYQGLLGMPEMQIAGNGSESTFLRWFQDRSPGALPRPWVFSVPLYVYRIAMLLWALWIAWALLSWLKWAWKCFNDGGTWKPLGILKKKPTV